MKYSYINFIPVIIFFLTEEFFEKISIKSIQNEGKVSLRILQQKNIAFNIIMPLVMFINFYMEPGFAYNENWKVPLHLGRVFFAINFIYGIFLAYSLRLACKPGSLLTLEKLEKSILENNRSKFNLLWFGAIFSWI